MGLGWDTLRRTIDASEEWWIERLAVVPAAKMFKFSGIEPEFEEKLDRMFGGVVATGNFACSASEAVSAGNDVNLGTPAGSDSSTDVPSPEQIDFDNIPRPKKPMIQTRRTTGYAFLRNQIDKIVTSYNLEPQVPYSTTVEEGLELLSDMPEIYEDEAFSSAEFSFI